MLKKSTFQNQDVLSMEQLTHEANSSEIELSMALEELQQNFQSLESTQSQMLALESLYSQLEVVESISTESYGLMLEQLPPMSKDIVSSLESMDIDQQSITLEGVSNLWDRLKQVYVSDWHSLVDSFDTLVGGVEKTYKSHKKIHSKLESEWADKKGSLETNKHNISLAGMSQTIILVKDDRLIREPLKDLGEDVEYSEYIMSQYPEEMVKYAEELMKIVGSGDLSEDDKFEKDVLSKVVKLGHPRDVFDLDIVGKPSSLIGNRYLIETKAKSKPSVASGSDYKDLAKMLNGVYVKHKLINWRDLFRSNEIIYDIEVTPEDVDKYLEIYGRYIDCISKAKGRIFTSMKYMKKFSKSNIDTSDARNLSSDNTKAFIQISELVKSMDKYITNPTNDEIGRVKSIVQAFRTVVSRTIATFK